MNEMIKNTLKLAQILFLLFIPVVILQFCFPQAEILGFVAPINLASVTFFSKFTPTTINGVDWSLLFVILPWIFAIIGAGILVNISDKADQAVKEKAKQIKQQATVQKIQNKEVAEREKLSQRKMIYMTISIIFSKFTISNYSDREIDEKKAEIKSDLIKDLPSYRGKVIEDEAFDDEDTFALLFTSQDDAIGYILKFEELITYYDDVVQEFGYGIAFKAILDCQTVNAVQFDVLQFMEKALRAIEIGEICTTNAFAQRYKEFGKMKQISFVSKGNYSISRERVELNRLIH